MAAVRMAVVTRAAGEAAVTTAWRGAWPLVALASAVSACGGEGGERPELGQGGAYVAEVVNPCPGGDFEFSEDGLESWDFEEGQAPGWVMWTDGTEGSWSEPANNRESPRTSPIPDKKAWAHPCGSTRALHVQATGLNEYGGQFVYRWQPELHDVSDWDGVSLWLRKGDEPGGDSLLVSVWERFTDANAAAQAGVDPICKDSPLEKEKCDQFTEGVGFADEWRFYAIRFDEMKQDGFGVRAPYFDLAGAANLVLSFERGDWDFWVDDVALFREKQ